MKNVMMLSYGFLSTFFKMSKELYLVLDLDGSILFFNKYSSRLLGLETFTLPINMKKYIDASSKGKFDRFLIEVQKSPQTDWEINMINENDDVYPVLMSGTLAEGYIMCSIVTYPREIIKLQEEIMTINNELTNMKRELEKKNALLTKQKVFLEEKTNMD